MNDLVIFGTGGHAREVHQLVEDVNATQETWQVLGFLDGNASRHGSMVHGLPVLGGVEWLTEHSSVRVVVAVGNTAAKRKIVRQIAGVGGIEFATLIHPRAWVGNRVQIGAGSMICAGALVTTDIEIHRHVIINIGTTVSHDTVIADFVTVAPTVNISGSVQVGEGCDLGTGSTIIQGIKIGDWSILGAGAVAVRDIPANVTAVGVPATVIKERDAGWHE